MQQRNSISESTHDMYNITHVDMHIRKRAKVDYLSHYANVRWQAKTDSTSSITSIAKDNNLPITCVHILFSLMIISRFFVA